MFGVEKPDHTPLLNDEEWYAKVVYLLDMFCHLNYLNMQGKEEKLLTSTDKSQRIL